MPHTEVLQQFTNRFPTYIIDVWFPNGRNSIRVRTVSGEEFIFTIISGDKWGLETKTYHIDKAKGELFFNGKKT